MKHTPGPWKTTQRDEHTWDVASVDWGGIAVLHDPYREGEALSALKADARLIAAAPELLAALRGCVNLMQDIRGAYNDVIGTESEPGWIEDIRDALAPAMSAIAKAEGRI